MRVNVTRQVFLVTGAVVGLLVTGVCAHAVTIDVGSTNGLPGSTVTFQVKLNTQGSAVGGTTNDISFDPVTPITACEVNPVFAALSNVGFLPTGCSPGVNCTGVRAVMLVFGGSIPNGSVLYTCTVQIAASAVLGSSFPLTCSDATSSTPNAMPLSTQCSNAEIFVSATLPTPTATATPTATSAPAPALSGGGGGCATGDATWSRLAWMLLLPPVLMLWRRQRGR
jgi:hypothetical protein